MNLRQLSPLMLVVLTVILVAGPCFAQQSLELLPARADDLVPQELVVPLTDKDMSEIERAPVSFSWPLPRDQKLDLVPQPHQGLSKSYWREVSAAELQAGVELPTVSSGAFIRINPLAEVDSAQLFAIDPISLEIAVGAGKGLDSGAAMEMLADAEQIKAAGSPFPAGTSAFRLRPDLGSGQVKLRAPELRVEEGTRYLVHVLERDSTVTLDLATKRDAYLSGQLLDASTVLLDGDQELQIEKIEGTLRSPDGEIQSLKLSRTSAGSYRIGLQLQAAGISGPGLWEIQVRISGKSGELQVQRDVRTAFGCAQPTARLTGLVSTKSGQELSARLGVEVAAAGRYELRGVLFGTDATGTLQPLAMSHAAAWIEGGEGVLTLTIGNDILEQSALSAPYEVRDLRLIDQSRMGLLHRQAHGFAINH